MNIVKMCVHKSNATCFVAFDVPILKNGFLV